MVTEEKFISITRLSTFILHENREEKKKMVKKTSKGEFILSPLLFFFIGLNVPFLLSCYLDLFFL